MWLPAVWQVFPAFSKGVWRCPSLFNTFIFLTYTAILTPVFPTNWANTLEILITGKTNYTVFCLEMLWATLWSYNENYKLLLKYLPIPSSWGDLSLWTPLWRKSSRKTAEELCWYHPSQSTFSVFRDLLWSKQLILLWCATPPQRVSNELKGAISGYLPNLM